MFRIAQYSDDLFDKWNDFVALSNNGTIFHRLDFLSYHGERFRDNCGNLLFYKGESIAAVMPLAIFPGEAGGAVARSPFGASYGGLVTREALGYSACRELVSALIEHLRAQGVSEVRITPSIQICHEVYCETLLFAFLEQGFRVANSDISSVVPLQNKELEGETFTSRARNMARKGTKAGVRVALRAPVEEFWPVMEKTFARHGTSPTHSFEQWKWLCARLPEDAWCDVAYLDDRPVAGVGHFRINGAVDSSFYLCSDPEFRDTQALSLLVYETILEAARRGFRYFDFGTSSVNMAGRDNIFRFKESYGAVGYFRHSLVMEL